MTSGERVRRALRALRPPGRCMSARWRPRSPPWLDARAHGGRWLVRIEDVDTPRCVSGADRLIPRQLAACGLVPDGEPLWQSTARRALPGRARAPSPLVGLPCACTRSDIERARWPRRASRAAWRRAGLPRHLPRWLAGPRRLARCACAPSFFTCSDEPGIHWHDRRLGNRTPAPGRSGGRLRV